MICKKPYMVEGQLPVGCGQCLPCRISKRREWGHRQYLEARTHNRNCFVTLTFDEDHVNDDQGSVSRQTLKLFLGRLRERVGYSQFRYFAVGEYGDESWRPHYHINIFGLGPEMHQVIKDCWKFGHVYVLDFCLEAALYVARYTVKKMTKPDDWRLDGRSPEFPSMSRRPGIGAPAAAVIRDQLMAHGWDPLMDVPKNLNLGRKTLVLGRYVRNILREEMEVTDDVKELIKERWAREKMDEMLPLRLAASSSTESPRQHLVKSWKAQLQKIEASQHYFPKGVRL